MDYPFDPNEYDLFHIGVSGGKDSAALLLWAYRESGLPTEKLYASFSDTNNEDPLTYGFIKILHDHVAPIHTLKPELDFWELAAKKRRFPSRMARFCTQQLKVIPSREHVLELMRSGKRVLLLNGVRKDEAHNGNDRGTVEPYTYDDGYGAHVWRPILGWGIREIWDIHRRYLKTEWVTQMIQSDPELAQEHKLDLIGKIESHGIPRNPLYDMGARRVGCFPCINSAKAEVRAIAKFRPGKIDFIAEKEETVGGSRGSATMFVAKTVPPRFQSREWVRESDGKVFKLATIRDVVAWSQTGHWARGLAEDDAPDLCDSAAGACE